MKCGDRYVISDGMSLLVSAGGNQSNRLHIETSYNKNDQHFCLCVNSDRSLINDLRIIFGDRSL